MRRSSRIVLLGFLFLLVGAASAWVSTGSEGIGGPTVVGDAPRVITDARKGGVTLPPSPCDCPPDTICLPQPRVGFVTPESGATFQRGTPVDVEVFGCDLGGNGNETISTFVACPGYSAGYSVRSFRFTPAAAGTCTLTAYGDGSPMSADKAAKVAPATLTISILDSNAPPTLEIFSPAPQTNYIAPANVEIGALATDPNGTVSIVEFRVTNRDTGAIISTGSDTTSPYNATANGVGVGNYRILARAIDNEGAATEAIRDFGVSRENRAPVVTWVAPAAGNILVPSVIRLQANASDPDPTDVVTVQFFADGQAISSQLNAPYRFDWSPPIPSQPRTYQLTARASDGRSTTISAPAVSITVTENRAPTVALAVDNTWPVLSPGQAILNATVTEPDGQAISRVEFYRVVGGTEQLIGTATAPAQSNPPLQPSPVRYSVTWANPPVGPHSLIARAFDSAPTPRSGTSPSVPLTVAANRSPSGIAVKRPFPGQNCPSSGSFEYSGNIRVGPAAGPLTVEANVADPDGDIRRVEFFQFSPNIITPSTSGNEAQQFAAMIFGAHGATSTSRIATVHASAPGQTVFTTDINLPALRVTPFMTGIYAVGYDSGDQVVNAALATTPDPPIAFIGGCATNWTYWRWAPIAYNPSNVPPGMGNPCGSDPANPGQCASRPHSVPGRIEAERYNQGGQGIGYFEIDPYTFEIDPYTRVGATTPIRPRTDDVDLRNCERSDLDPSCTVGRLRPGEWLKYTLNFTQGGQYRLIACLSPSNGLGQATRSPDGETRLKLDVETIGESGWVYSSRSLELQPLSQAAPTERAQMERAATSSPCAGNPEIQYGILGVFPSGFRADMRVRFNNTVVEANNNLDWFQLDLAGPESLAVRFETPSNGDSVAVGTTARLPLVANVTSNNGSTAGIAVDFQVQRPGSSGFVTFQTAASAPFVADFPPVGGSVPGFTVPGNYVFRAVARAGVLSAETLVTVTATANPANQAPVVTLVPPANGGIVNIGSTTTFAVDARDPDGTVTEVEFLRNGISFSPRLVATPQGLTDRYTANWTAGTTPETFRLSARALDNRDPPGVGVAVTGADIIVAVPGSVLAQETPDAIPSTIAPESDGVGATAGTFRVDETGAATYTIPLATVPGRGGVVPELAVSYSSQGGLGVLGRGWSVSGASAIMRCRQTRENGDAAAALSGSPPLSFDQRDRYCLDGQRLLLVSGSYAGPTAEFRTELDQFARIRAYDVDATNGFDYFVVQRKDGTTAWYGDRIAVNGLPFLPSATQTIQRPDAALRRNAGNGVLPPNNAPILTFALARSMDSFGNYVDYTYVTDQVAGQQLLASVRYTGKVRLEGQQAAPGDQEPFAEVLFNHLPLPAAEQTVAWQAGMAMRRTRYLDSITSRSGSADIRHYRLAYQISGSGSGHRLLTSLTECSNRLGGAVCYRPTVFAYTQAQSRFIGSSESAFPNTTQFKSSKLGDVDGDGRLDLVWFDNRTAEPGHCPAGFPTGTQRIWTEFGGLDGAGNLRYDRGGQLHACSLRPYSESLDDAWFLVDYNGDGRDDLMIAGNNGGTIRWRVYPSRGRVSGQQVFNQSIDLLSDCAGGSTDAAGCVPLPGSNETLAQLADVNGDGLPDVLYATTASSSEYDVLKVKLMERDGAGYRFSAAYQARFEWDAGEQCGQPIVNDPELPQRQFRGCRFSFSNSDSRSGRSPQPIDLDADGRADLLLAVRQTFSDPCTGTSCPPPPQSRSIEAAFYVPASAADAERLRVVAPAVQSGLRVGNRRDVHSLHRYGLVVREIVPAAAGTPAQIVFRKYLGRETQSTEGFSYFFGGPTPADVNGDGLTDLLWRQDGENGDSLLIDINSGAGMRVGTTVSGITGRKFMQLVDINQDGRTDIVHLTGSGTSERFRVRIAGPDGVYPTVSTVLPGTDIGAIDPQSWFSNFTDLDGDGGVDFGAWQLGRETSNFRQSRGLARNGASGDRHVPRDLIAQITNGYGAATVVQYESLANGAVYWRDSGSRNEVISPRTDRGSPVQDLLASMHVVASVVSDAPGIGALDRKSRVDYQYQGAKVQGGGRGLLGFREIRSIDSNFDNAHVVTITRYDQMFPFIGMPLETRKIRVNGVWVPPACRTAGPEAPGSHCFTAGNQPPEPPGAPATNPFFAEPVGTLLSFSANRLARQTTTTGIDAAPVHAFIDRSFEAMGHPESASVATLSETVSAFQYNTFGDATVVETATANGVAHGSLAALRTHASNRMAANDPLGRCGGVCLTRLETESLFSADTTYWRLGRVTESSVEHWRGTQVRPRLTRFEYDMTGSTRTGALRVERIQPDVVPNQDLRTVRVRDDYGNVTMTLSCSGDVPASECDDAADANAMRQRPAGAGDLALESVRRFAETGYDASGRYANTSRAPYFTTAGVTQAVRLTTQTTISRDLLGNPTRTEGLNGQWATAAFGPLGRQTLSEDATGAASATEFHWCQGVNGGTREAECPTAIGAVFRQTSYVRGGPRSIAYFDRLGRQVFTMAESFNRYDTDAANDWVATCTTYDGRGRTVAVTEPYFLAGTGSSLPGAPAAHNGCAGAPSTRTSYDVLDRATQILLPEHTSGAPAGSSMLFNGLTTTTETRVVRDSTGDDQPEPVVMTEIRVSDASGKVITVTDDAGMQTQYAYNEFGDLASVTRDAGRGAIVSTVSYDALGRKTTQSDPDAGTVNTFYNAAGEVICTRDARGFATITDRDALGRTWRTRSFNGLCSTMTIAETRTDDQVLAMPLGTGTSAAIDLITYDLATNGTGLAQRSVRRQTVGDSYESVDRFEQVTAYGILGRPDTVTTMVRPPGAANDEVYTASTTYDALGRVATSTDATGGRVENMYSAHGFLRRVRDAANPTQLYWELQATDARGQTTLERRHGNVRLTTARTYNTLTGRLQVIRSGLANGSGGVDPTNAIQNLGYAFDAQGNLLSREDLRANVRETFTYDDLNRLVSGRLRPANNSLAAPLTTISLAYDRLGNICSKNGHAYTYAGRAGCGTAGVPGSADGTAARSPHAVTRRAMQTGFVDYAYDAAGYQTAATVAGGGPGSRTVRYDAAGNADRISAGTTSTTHFRYAAGGRYLRVDSEGGNTTVTRYLAGVEWLTRNGAAFERRRYIGGFLILTETGTTAAPTRQFRYVFTDHLGSMDTLVDQNGTVIERFSFDAHGSRRSADGANAWSGLISNYTAPTTRRGFTGHEHVDSAGIVHMNGRLYDAALGRMLSPDPIVQEPFNAQNLNRYTYVLNNPLSYTDPSGLSFVKKYWRQIASIAINMFLPGAGWFTGLFGQGLANTLVTGFISGVVSSGSLQGGLMGAFSAGVFHGIGKEFASMAKGPEGSGFWGTRLTGGQFAAKVLTHGIAGGMMSTLQGGKFGHGFASAGVAQLAAPGIDGLDEGNAGFSATRVAAAAIVGGTASVLSGGKFANGAVTAAFARAYNDERHRGEALDHKLFLIAERGTVGHVFLGGVAPNGEYEAWGFYPTEKGVDALTEGEGMNGVVRDDSALFMRAMQGDRNFAFRVFDVTASTYRHAMAVMKGYASTNDYGVARNSCVSAAFTATSSVGLTPGLIEAMPYVHPNAVFDAFRSMPNRTVAYKHESWNDWGSLGPGSR